MALTGILGSRGPAADDIPSTGAGGPGRRAQLLATVPVLVALLAALVLSGLNLNGSSIANLAPGQRHSSVLFGQAQGLRSDEWNLATPNVIGNVRRGLPVQPWIGLTPTFLPASAVLLPAKHWTTLFKPQDWPFLVPGLGLSHAFALRWWSYLFIGFVGVYALLFQLSRSVLVSSAVSVAVAFAPTTAWWSDNPAPTIGFLAGALAALVVATRCRRLWATIALGAVAGWLAAADVLLLYPPWQVSLAWVCAAVGVGWLLDRRPRWTRVSAALGAFAVVALPAVGGWYLQSRAAIEATANTYYPGNRMASGGGGSLSWLLDGPVSLWLAGGRTPGLFPQDRTFLGDPLPFVNASELSSGWIPLPLLAVAIGVIAAPLIRGHRPRASGAVARYAGRNESTRPEGPTADQPGPLIWTGVLTALVFLLLLAWMLLPLPDLIGRVTLLGRVTGRRVPVAAGLAAGVLLVIAMTAARGLRRSRGLTVAVLLGVLATVASTVWAVAALPWRHHVAGGSPPPPSLQVAAVALVLAIGAGLLVWGRYTGMASVLLATLALVTYAVVNPVNRGLGPLDHDPLVKALAPLAKTQPELKAVAYGHVSRLHALVAGSGAQTLSGLTVYPDAEVWQRLAPDQEHNWNQYSKYDWIADPTIARPTIKRVSGTQQDLVVNPCSAQILGLGIDIAVSPDPIDVPCLHLQKVVPDGAQNYYLYRYGTS